MKQRNMCKLEIHFYFTQFWSFDRILFGTTRRDSGAENLYLPTQPYLDDFLLTSGVKRC